MEREITFDQSTLSDTELLMLYRFRKGLNQANMAKTFGMAQNSYSRRESGVFPVPAEILEHIRREEDFSKLTKKEYFALLRKRSGLSVKDLCKKFYVSRQAIADVEYRGAAIDKYLGFMQSAV